MGHPETQRRPGERAGPPGGGGAQDPRGAGRGGSPDGGSQPSAALVAAGAGIRRWVPPLAALLVLLSGVVDIGSVLTPEITSRVRMITDVVTGPVARSASAATAAIGLLLVLLSHGLRRRKRRAWRAAVVLLAGASVFSVVKGLDVEESALSAVVAVLLVVYRKEFRAAGDPRTRWRALAVLVQLLLASFVIGELLVTIRSERIVGNDSFGAQLQHVAYGLAGVHGPLQFRSERYDDFVTRVLFGLGLVTIVVMAYLVLRPAEPQARLVRDDEERIRGLLAKHGDRDSLGYFALRRDKSVLWSASGKACISYRVVSGVMLASGDPLGDPEAWPGAIGRFLEVAAEHAWTPAVMGCSEQAGTAWTRAGLDALELGDEAIVEVADFTLEGRAMRNVRQAVNRVERAGYTSQVRRVRDLSRNDLAELRTQASAWRGTETERGFSMALGRFGDSVDGDCVVATAHDGGKLAAFLHFVPWGSQGLSLDVMRRDRAADNGLNELLIAKVLLAAPALGVCRVSLNFAIFRSSLARGERIGAGFVLRLWRNLLLLASHWFQIESLYRFNAKFQPLWEPRYVCYPVARDLVRIAIAALEAEAFIVWPRPRLRFLGGIVGGPHPRETAEPTSQTGP